MSFIKKTYIWNIYRILYKVLKYSIKFLHFVRITITNILFMLLIILIIIIYLNVRNPVKSLPKNTALVLDINGTIVDKPATYNTFKKISQNLLNTTTPNTQENSLFDVINIIRQAKNDSNITGLILSLKNFSGCNQTSLEYIGKVLREFQSSGKVIYAISDYYSQSQYFLASYANKIFLTPQGTVDLRGMYTNRFYYKSLLDNLKINTHIFRVGEYKSAVEPFMQNQMSLHVRNEEKKLINYLWNQYLNIVAINRKTTIQKIFPGITTIINGLSQAHGNTAVYALKNNWIDEIAPYSEIENKMKKIFGYDITNSSLHAISMYDYHIKTPKKHNNQIAIICVNGPIIDGTDNAGIIGGDTIVQNIRNARLNPKVKAIVLRVNSPGGSVNASELIRLELISTKNSGKPIVVCMGSIAASGGYWISTPANVIIANNNTLTGSIGIFGIINTFEKSLDSIGIHSDGVDTSPIANISSTKSLPPEYVNMMQIYVNTNYHYFVNTVATARCKTINDVKKIAQGHIWLGHDAIRYGLIDCIGDLDDAINTAANLANLKEYQINWYKDQANWIDSLMKATNKILLNIITDLFNQHNLFTNFNKNIQINYSDIISPFKWNDPKNCYALYSNYDPFIK
ncbi:signal peptide peptidase SppA [Candidatus Blochmannia ocreatus (nom. nud.)]|uniref:Signal peptide peptidase SppA n=1 Tax=Candidatus Blochmannia ocreatus (nom. nud.) TaxID=251538 RepID=A0ABY4SSH2_9ENTR|nr:signal peptide peptidase SppA [Candidatus Blochmannia ocreatus]URJ24935.1 signal peptide peptidase SppA [Candidatus Blochmannia ocreatus]